jgi:hypothetical protein
LSRSYRLAAALAGLVVAAGGATAFADDGGHGDHHRGRHEQRHGAKVLESKVFGSDPAGPILFGVHPGGLPWVVSRSRVEVRRDGRVEVRVRGLVIRTPPQNGTNPVSNLAATVFCNGSAVGTTHAVPFSSAGGARIEDTLATPLPSPCLVPAVLLNPAPDGTIATGTYIAATGR